MTTSKSTAKTIVPPATAVFNPASTGIDNAKAPPTRPGENDYQSSTAPHRSPPKFKTRSRSPPPGDKVVSEEACRRITVIFGQTPWPRGVGYSSDAINRACLRRIMRAFRGGSGVAEKFMSAESVGEVHPPQEHIPFSGRLWRPAVPIRLTSVCEANKRHYCPTAGRLSPAGNRKTNQYHTSQNPGNEIPQ